MNFLYPLFTLAALAIAIPVVIHLFNFRKYKKVMFPDIRFLKELMEQTQKHSQLKHLLVLACRILAILGLVFAFAQPYFSKDEEKIHSGPKAVSIYLDNSYSMGIEQSSISLLDNAKAKAKEIIESYDANDRIQILTNDFAYNENRFLSKDEALRQLGNIQVSPKTRNAQTILEKQKQLLQTEPGRQQQLIYISDFQKKSFASNLNVTDSIKKYFVPVKANNQSNIAIDTAYFETPSILLNQANPVVVKLKNNSNEEVNTSLSLMVNEQLKSVANTSLQPNETKSETISFTTSTAGKQNIKIFVHDYPVSFDDTFYIAGKANANYSVLIINQSNANAFLSSVFKPGSQFRMDNTNVNAVNTSLLKNYTLIILNSLNVLPEKLATALESHLIAGGSVLTFAPKSGSTEGINIFLNKVANCMYQNLDTAKAFVSDYNKSHEVFRDIFTKTPENIDLPVVYKHYVISDATLSTGQKLFSFSNSDPFLSAYKTGNGNLYVCASDAEINSSNFPKSYWFLPLIYKMAYMNSGNPIYALTLGKNAGIFIENQKTNTEMVYHMGSGEVDAIPEQRVIGNRMQISLNNGIQKAGLYHVYLPGSNDTSFVGLNYDRSESELQYWNLDELKKTTNLKNAEWMSDSFQNATSINELQHGMPLWKLCITLALLFLLAEVLLIRFMK